jgi:uncharacterized membrane protein
MEIRTIDDRFSKGLLRPGRILFAISIAAFGIQNLLWAQRGDPVTRMIPWLPGQPILVWLVGTAFIAAGICILFGLRARETAIVLGFLFLVFETFLQVPRAVARPMDLGLRTVVFEDLTLWASAFLFAGLIGEEGRVFGRWNPSASQLTRSGRFFLAVSMVVFGVTHFLIPGYIASLIPRWIPGPGLFWAYFTGAAFVAAGLSFAANRWACWAAPWLGLMFLLWFLLLHLPRIASYPRSQNPDEWSSAFIALGICGGSWIAAAAFSAGPAHRRLEDWNQPAGTSESSGGLYVGVSSSGTGVGVAARRSACWLDSIRTRPDF